MWSENFLKPNMLLYRAWCITIILPKIKNKYFYITLLLPSWIINNFLNHCQHTHINHKYTLAPTDIIGEKPFRFPAAPG